ncbi:glycerophosphodiester phosphodiesterase GDPD6-like isoform X2 [Amaranthus tricolor]|uniref:glycerophosphodiester phosphodiesterase GDPD6-like isoform X2 n=1 Tax=Amaranthus tricolor TaxID=29722 RepID=UPI0025911652|nr:glycerophosphodiester phosphodiesterase GDPD6-like isoform X2 [Amaranthus tricolor]
MASLSNCTVLFTLLLLFVRCSARRSYLFPSIDHSSSKRPLQTSRPYNLAHRGSNGEFPEETAAAYLRSIHEGADFIETDILSSKDGVLICHHDVILDNTTDISDHKEFADRKRIYEVQGSNITGFFTVDFTWKELQTLRAKQRFSFRDQQYNGKFPIITFEEYIDIALDAPRVVGIYPEIKDPIFINKHVKWPNGKKFEDVFIDTLNKHGYRGSYLSKDWLKQPCFVQSFAPSSLVYISNKTDLPKILLIGDTAWRTEDTNQVHPYTFRNENQYLHFEFYQDPYQEFEFWINKMKVDGLFTDFTGSLHSFQEWTSPLSRNGTMIRVRGGKEGNNSYP